jgi:F-type H+-transporting ATPase subunit beta
LLAESSGVSAEHVKVAQQLRQLLGSPDTYMQEPAVLRAKRLQNFLTQPFFVAEAYTDMPGEYVGVEDTIKGCKELLEGRYDHVPLEAFWFVGTIEQALQNAKGM